MPRQQLALRRWLTCLAAQAAFQAAVPPPAAAILKPVQTVKRAVRRKLSVRQRAQQRLVRQVPALRQRVLLRPAPRLHAPLLHVPLRLAKLRPVPLLRVLPQPAPRQRVKLRPVPHRVVRLLPDGRMRECGREDTPPSFFRPHFFTILSHSAVGRGSVKPRGQL